MSLPLLLEEPVTQSLRLSATEKGPENYRVYRTENWELYRLFAEQVRRTPCSILVLTNGSVLQSSECAELSALSIYINLYTWGTCYVPESVEHRLRTEPRLLHNHSLAAMSPELSTRVLSTRQIKIILLRFLCCLEILA